MKRLLLFELNVWFINTVIPAKAGIQFLPARQLHLLAGAGTDMSKYFGTRRQL